MRKAPLLAAAGLLCHGAAAPAHAAPPDTVLLQSCSFTTITSIFGEDKVVASVDAGPLVVGALPSVTDPDPLTVEWDQAANPVSATLRCDVQVGSVITHDGPDAARAEASGTGVVVLPPTLVTFDWPPDQELVVCTSVVLTDARGDTETRYLSYSAEEKPRLTTDPGSECAIALHPSPQRQPEPLDPFCAAVSDRIWTEVSGPGCEPFEETEARVWEPLDAAACPVFEGLPEPLRGLALAVWYCP